MYFDQTVHATQNSFTIEWRHQDGILLHVECMCKLTGMYSSVSKLQYITHIIMYHTGYSEAWSAYHSQDVPT